MPRAPRDRTAIRPEQKEIQARVVAIKDALRREIRVRDLTETEVASRLGYGRSFLSNTLTSHPSRNASGLRVETLLGVLDILGLEPGSFLRRVDLARKSGGVASATATPLSALSLVSGGAEPSAAQLDQIVAMAEGADKLPPAQMTEVLRATLAFVQAWTKALVPGSLEPPADPPKS